MSQPIIGINAKVEAQSALASPVTVTAITKANPGVVSATAHGYIDGDVVVLAISSGMSQADGQAVRVANKTTDDFECEGLDTTSFDTFVAGTVRKVSTWVTLAKATAFSMPQASPPDIDVTVLLDTEQQVIPGLLPAFKGSIPSLFDPGSAAEALVKSATRNGTPTTIRATYTGSGGAMTITNSRVSGGSGFAMDKGGVATTETSFSGIRQPLHYAAP
ncbi:MAG: phage tail tube protein [Sinimarinibacterium sp.]|jgi:hypothetical protein